MTIINIIPGKLEIGAILSKCCSLYSSTDNNNDVSMEYEDTSEADDVLDDDEDEEIVPDDCHLDDLLDQDLNWELEMARRKKLWRSKEEVLRNRNKSGE